MGKTNRATVYNFKRWFASEDDVAYLVGLEGLFVLRWIRTITVPNWTDLAAIDDKVSAVGQSKVCSLQPGQH